MPFKTFFLTVILWVGYIGQGCQPCSDCGKAPRFIDVERFDLRHSNFGSSREKKFQGSISMQGYALALTPYGRLYGYYDLFQPKESIWNISLMSCAMACTCGESYIFSETEILKNVIVTTLNDFDGQHPAGSSINDILQVVQFGPSTITIPLEIFLKDNTSLISSSTFYLGLTKAPINPFQVKVKIELSTGEIYEAESTAVTIVP